MDKHIETKHGPHTLSTNFMQMITMALTALPTPSLSMLMVVRSHTLMMLEMARTLDSGIPVQLSGAEDGTDAIMDPLAGVSEEEEEADDEDTHACILFWQSKIYWIQIPGFTS